MSSTLKIRRALVAPGVLNQLECIMNVLMYYESYWGPIGCPRGDPKKPPWRTVGPSVGALGRLSDAHLAFLGHLWRVLGDLGTIAVDLGSNLVNLGAILVDLGSNFVRSQSFCDAVSLKWVESLAEEPNPISTRYGRVQMRFDAFAHE